jgi:hypothetical protein
MSMRHPFDGINPAPEAPLGEGTTRRSVLRGMLGALVALLGGAAFARAAAPPTERPKPRPTTQALGEEGGLPTERLGEDGRPGPTTLALGEEGGRPRPTTAALGEEGGLPTERLGEDGRPGPTTLAVGEEGGRPTLRLGEGGGSSKSLGEEGGIRPPTDRQGESGKQ